MLAKAGLPVVLIAMALVPAAAFAEGQVPSWLKTTAGLWADGDITDKEFLTALQWLIDNGLLQVSGDGSEAVGEEPEKGGDDGGLLGGLGGVVDDLSEIGEAASTFNDAEFGEEGLGLLKAVSDDNKNKKKIAEWLTGKIGGDFDFDMDLDLRQVYDGVIVVGAHGMYGPYDGVSDVVKPFDYPDPFRGSYTAAHKFVK